jgi:RHS repeat-associated protein
MRLNQRLKWLAVIFYSTVAYAELPVCQGPTCTPDTTASSYAGAVDARPMVLNARGNSNPLWPTAAAGVAKTVLGSQSYNFTIPILSLPGRAGMGLVLNLYYSSRIWNVDNVHHTTTFNIDRDYPSYGFRLDFGYLEKGSSTFILTEGDGTKHNLAQGTDPAKPYMFYSIDGTHIQYNNSTTMLSYKSGITVQYLAFPSSTSRLRPVWIKDSNGNYFSIAYVSGYDQLISAISDSLGRVVTFNYDSSQRLTSLTQLVHPSGTKTYVTFSWGTVYGNGYAWYNFSGLTVHGTPDLSTPLNVLTGCTYSNNTGYKFNYGDWGIINEIDNLSSTGAVRSYVSYNFPQASQGALTDAPAYTQQTVSPDGTSANTSIWTYAVTKSGTGVVTSAAITDPNGNSSITNLDPNTGQPTSVQLKDSSNNVLRASSYTWTTTGSAPVSTVLSSIVTTLSDSGQQSKIAYGYDPWANVTDIYEYDFGLTLLRHTVTTYLTTGDYGTFNLVNRPTQILMKDGNGNTVARTDMAYDGIPLTSVTGAADHDDTSFSTSFTTRGNLTSVTRYSNASAGTGAVTHNFNYDTLGNTITEQLDCCNQKTFSFSSTTQYAFPDSVTRGPSVGPQFTSSYTYDPDSSLLLTSTDENGQTTHYQYDSMNRTTQVQLPPQSGTQVQQNITYGDDTVSPTVTTSNTANSAVTVSTVDGLGHVMQVDEKNGSTVVSTVKYTYDKLWRRTQASNPYAPGDTVVYTQFTYDALGRPKQTTPPSAGHTQYDYSGNSVTITDPAGNQRKTQTDAMGRLVEVDEPGAAFAGTNASGTVTISGTEQAQRSTAAPGPPANGTLLGFAEPSGVLHFMYLANSHASDMSLNGNQYTFTDASAAAGAPTTSSTPFTSFRDPSGALHWAYLDSHQHIMNVYKSSGAYGYQDATAGAGAPAAATGGKLVGFTEANGTQHWAFASSVDIGNLYWNGGYGYKDATSAAGAPAGGPLAGFIDASGGLHWAGEFLYPPQRPIYYHAFNLYDNSGTYGSQDVTAASGAPTISSTSSLAAFGDPSGGQHWAYFAYASNDLINVYWNACCGYGFTDLITASGAPGGSGTLTAFADPSGKQHWAYFSNGHVIHVYGTSASGYRYEDVTALSGALSAIQGSPITAFADPSGGLHFAYSGATYGHLYHIYSSGGGYAYDDASFQASTDWDSGTVSLAAGSYTATTNYGHNIGQNSTGAAVAAALVANMQSQLPASNPPFSISVPSGGTTITINWNSVGVAGNVNVTTTSTTSQPQYFFPSFTGCGAPTSSPTQTCNATLSGGQDPYSPGLGHPYATTYTYDALDNITAISQAAGNFGGQVVAGQPRSYSYDSLSRMLTVTTPESGTMTNYYTDASGNACAGDPSLVCRAQDARGIVRTYTYDSINRPNGVSYSDGTAGVTYTYDTGGAAAFALGRLTNITEGTNSQTFTYDNLGRITSVAQVVDSVTYPIGYSYNLASQLTSITYPTGRVVNQNVDAIGRLSSIASGSTTYLSGLSYNAAGETLGLTLGNGVQGTFGYNDHLQLASLRYFKSGSPTDVLNLGYDYGANDNGQIQAMRYYTSPGVEDATKSESFNYDPWMRLSSAHTGVVNSTAGTWSMTWGYDRLGNRLNQVLTGGNISANQPNFTVDPATNHITNSGYQYDATGNLTNDSVNAFSYDGANRVKQFNGGAAAYTYFGPLRIKKVVGSTTTVYVYAGTKPIVEYVNGVLSAENIYAGSKLLAVVTASSTIYCHPDHLSTRAQTDATGAVVGSNGHLPFGDDWYVSGNSTKWKFATYERDAESGNIINYAQFRYYYSTQGRFMSPDPLGGDIGDPQSLGRYTYVRNDPINSADPSGLLTIDGIDWGGPFAFSGVSGLLGFNGLAELPPGVSAGANPVPGGFAFPQVDAAGNISYSFSFSMMGRGGVPLTDAAIAEVLGLPGSAGFGQQAQKTNSIMPWNTHLRDLIIAVLRGKNDCSNWFNQGNGSAADVMSHVSIRLVNNTENPPVLNPADASTYADPSAPIDVDRWGRFYPDSNNGLLVGGVYGAGTLGARMVILLHELAHKIMPPGFTPDGRLTDPADASDKNTARVMEHCAKAIDAQHW